MKTPAKLETQYLEQLKKKKVFPLHIHWDGSIPAEDLFSMVQTRSTDILLPEQDINGTKIEYDTPDKRIVHNAQELQCFMQNLRMYNIIDVFSVATRFMQTKEDLIATAVAHCKYLKSQNAPYAETRFAPQYHTFKGLNIEQVIAYAVEGFEQGKTETDVDVRLIISIGREVDTETGVKIADAVINCEKKFPTKIVGIDLACEERGNPPEKHYPAFKQTFDTPLKRTVHAGEMCDEQTNLHNIAASVYLLRADGLGHAIHLHKDKGLIATIRTKKIRIESNPVCNNFFFGTNIEDLHLDELVTAGVLITINPDDPAMIPNGDLVHNLYHLGKLYGNDFVNKLIRNSVEASWGMTAQEKEYFLNTTS